MNKFLFALLALVAMSANAQGFVSFAYQKDGEVVFLESRNNSIFLPKVAVVLEKAGYTRQTTSNIPPGTKTDTWCKVDVYHERQILGECYTPHQGHGVSVRNVLAESPTSYNEIPFNLATLRFEHRIAGLHLGIIKQ